MLLGNIGRIVEDNYSSLVQEAWGRGVYAKTYVFCLFIAIPVTLGALLGLWTPLWTQMISSLISVIGVLTGFSINAIVLLTSHSEENSYRLKTEVVNQTKDFTLYSILVGVLLLIVLTMGFLIVKNTSFAVTGIPRIGTLTDVDVISTVVYAVLMHYFLTLLVITHRLYTLVHGKALGKS